MAVTLLREGVVKDYYTHKILNPNTVAYVYIIDQLEKGVKHKIWLLEAKTGSGKSALLPPKIAERFPTKNIVSTQPRVFNAISIPEGLPQYYPFLKMGDNLGYSTGEQKVGIKQGLVYMTEPTLLSQLKIMKEEDFIRKWKFIVIDEVHVRSVGLDILFYKIKQMAERYKDNILFPQFILTSATFNVPRFAEYYNVPKECVLFVDGISFPKTITFEETPVDNFDVMIEYIIKIHKSDEDEKIHKGDIVIFIPGDSYVKELIKRLESWKDRVKPFDILNINSNTRDEARKILAVKSTTRRIIFGTNAIETGVTIDECKYVFDTGIEKFPAYHPPTGINFLLDSPISQGAKDQRFGRAGRKFDGFAHGFYTEDTMKNMIKDSYPDIQTKDFTNELLYLLIERFSMQDLVNISGIMEEYDTIHKKQLELLQKGKIKNEIDCFELIAPPGGESIARSLSNLHRLGYIDINNIPTKLGLIMFKLPILSFEGKRMVLSGMVFDVSLKELTIMAIMMVLKSNDLKIKGVQSVYDLYDDFGMDCKFSYFLFDECIENLILYYNFKKRIKKSPSKAKEWCQKNGFNYNTLIRCMNNMCQVTRTMNVIGLNYKSKSKFKLRSYIKQYEITDNNTLFIDFISKIKLCIYQGYKMNLITKNERGYWSDINGRSININFKSKLYKKIKNKPVNHMIYASSIYMDSNGMIANTCSTLSVMTGFVGIDEYFY